VTALRVLVVEDDAIIGALLAEVLADLGYDVCPVETTEAGSGVSAVDQVCQAGPVPYVFISGDVFQAAMPGAVLLRKPFRAADLVQAIGRALGAAGAQRPVPSVASPAALP